MITFTETLTNTCEHKIKNLKLYKLIFFEKYVINLLLKMNQNMKSI